MGRWQEVEGWVLKAISGLAIAAFLALNTPKFFLLFGFLALVYVLARALAPRVYGRLHKALRDPGPVAKPFASLGSGLGSRLEGVRFRRTKKRERRARFEAMRQDRQARLEAERLQRLALHEHGEEREEGTDERRAEDSEPVTVATQHREHEGAGGEFQEQSEFELEMRKKAREEIRRYLERQRASEALEGRPERSRSELWRS